MPKEVDTLGETLDLTEALSMALGGKIGGGIYAVLGVVAQIPMSAVWCSFLVVGIVAMCSGYCSTKLNSLTDNRGDAVAFFPLMMYNLSSREPNTLYMVLGIAAVVVTVQLLYVGRDLVEGEVEEFDSDVGAVVNSN